MFNVQRSTGLSVLEVLENHNRYLTCYNVNLVEMKQFPEDKFVKIDIGEGSWRNPEKKCEMGTRMIASLCQQAPWMITFTPLSGAARESRTTPLCYLLQIDDVKILIDCGSPDWAPEPSPFTPEQTKTAIPSWTEYCDALEKLLLNLLDRTVLNNTYFQNLTNY